MFALIAVVVATTVAWAAPSAGLKIGLGISAAVAVCVGLALLAGHAHQSDGRIELGIAAVGAAVALGLLAFQLRFDVRRSDADDRRLVQLNVSQTQVLDGATLTDTNLEGVSLLRKSLRNARLAGSRLGGADFTEAILAEADLRGVTGAGATFTAASLRYADLSMAHLSDADFTGADLAAADLTGFTCERCDFTNASLVGATLNGTTLPGSIALGSLWSPGVRGADLRIVLPGGDMSEAQLSGEDLSGMMLGGTNFRGAVLRGADLSGVSLVASNLAGADLTSATVDAGASLERVTIDALTLLPEGVSLVDAIDLSSSTPGLRSGMNADGLMIEGPVAVVANNLAGSSFRSTTLDDVDFSGVNLAGVDFSGSVFTNVRLAGATVSGANFRGADLSRVDPDDLASTIAEEPWLGVPPVYYDNATRLGAFVPNDRWVNVDVAFALSRQSLGVGLDGVEVFAPRTMMNWILNDLDLHSSRAVRFEPGTFQNLQARGADLRNLDLSGSDLYIAEFVGTDLRGARLQNTNIATAQFRGAALDRPDPQCTYLPPGKQTLSSCRSQFYGAVYDSRTEWPVGYEPPGDAINLDSDLTGLEIVSTSMSNNAGLIGLTAPGVNFSDSTFDLSNAVDSEFAGSTFHHVSAVGAKFDGSDMRATDLTSANFNDASLRGVDLRGAIFECTDLRGADLRGALVDPAGLRGAIVDVDTILPTDYSGPVSVADGEGPLACIVNG